MKPPAVLALIALVLIPAAQPRAEECQYPIQGADGGDRSLTLSTLESLQTAIDRNANIARVQAAYLDFKDPNPDKRYIRLMLTVHQFVPTGDEAEALSNDHSPVVPEGFPLMINFTDDTSVILTSLGMGVSRGTAPVAPPGRFGNDTDFFRVSHAFMGAYWVDDEQRTALMAKPVRRLQMTTDHGDHDVTVDPAKSDRIQFVLGCI